MRTADVVVLVGSSTKRALPRLTHTLATLREEIDARSTPVPVVLQANKQDMPGAVPPEALADSLGLKDCTILGARAHEGVGVLETFVAAVRQISTQLQQRADRDALLVTPAARSDEVLRALCHEQVPEDLEGAFSVEEEEEEEQPLREADDEPALHTSSADAAQPAKRHTIPFEGEPPASRVRPPLPSPDVPTGFIWPTTGREIVRRLAQHAPVTRDDLVGRHGIDDGSGKQDIILYECGEFCLKTSERRRFPDAESGRNALVRAARAKIQLGDLFLQQTVLILQPEEEDGSGSHWLWTVTPWLNTLRSRMSEASHTSDERALGEVLSTFARASVDAMVLASRQGLVLDVHPSNYAERDRRIVYLDDDIMASVKSPALGHALLRRVDEYASYPHATQTYLEALEQEIRRRLTSDDLVRLELAAAVEQALVRTEPAAEAKNRLMRTLRGIQSPAAPPVAQATVT